MNAQTETKPAALSQETVREATAIQLRTENKPLGSQLKDREKQFFAALPAHIPAERFIRIIMTAVNNSPALWHANRQSFWNACMRAAQDGLLPDGRDGALVIYKTKDGKDDNGRDVWIEKVQWMPMIGGIRKKVRNSGEIKDWNAQVVHAKDNFEFELGDAPYIKHKPFMDGDPGPVVAAYSIAQFKSGELSREVMTRSQIEKVRGVSRSKDKGPWVDWYDEMCRKTVARRHSKSLPMSSDLDDLIRRDDELYDLEGKSDRQHTPPLKSLGARLGALAGVSDADAMPENDTAVATDNDDRQDDADTDQGTPASPPAGGSLEPEQAAARQEPQTAAGGPSTSQATPAAAISQTPADSRAERDRLILADLLAEGAARAQAGSAALRNWLDGLTESGERKLLPNETVVGWIATAKKASGGRTANGVQ